MSDTLGIWLRRAREARQLGLADIEKRLRIRQRYLQALEVGDYTALPGEIQTRGFLRNYARFLGLPVEDILARYSAEIEGRPFQPRLPALAEPPRGRSRERTWAPPPPADDHSVAPVERSIPAGLIRGVLLAIVVLGVVVLGSYIALRVMERQAALSPAAPVAQPTPAAAAELAPTEAALPVFVPAADGAVRMLLVAKQSAWVSISADQAVVFQGVAEMDRTLEAAASDMLIVATGNGGAFQLYLNGTDWGLLGAQGGAVRRAWSPQGEIDLEEP